MSDVIAAAQEPINGWLQGPGRENFTSMRDEVDQILASLRELHYKGPNAKALEANTEQSMRALGEGSQKFMAALVEMISKSVGLVLGAGGHANIDALENGFTDAAFNIPDGQYEPGDFELIKSEFTAAVKNIQTRFDNIQGAAASLVETLTQVDNQLWQGAARVAAEDRFRQEVGTADIAINPEVTLENLGTLGKESGGKGEDAPTTLMQAFAINLESIGNTLQAQLNSAEAAEADAVQAIGA